MRIIGYLANKNKYELNETRTGCYRLSHLYDKIDGSGCVRIHVQRDGTSISADQLFGCRGLGSGYTYLGLGTIVEKLDGNGNKLTYKLQTGDTLAGGAGADGGDQYIGLDRFGRVVDLNWIDSMGAMTDRLQYAYDGDGNVLYKNDLIWGGSGSVIYHGDSTAASDDAAAYDALNRVVAYTPGTLSSSGNNGSFLDTTGGATPFTITLDAVSNITDRSGTPYVYNGQNQLDPGGTLPYDNNGNMTLEAGQTYTYDGWNRLISLGNSGFSTTYAYDAQGRRISSSVTGEDRYYDAGGQEIELHYSSSYVIIQNVWSIDYVNDMVLRDDGYQGAGNLGVTGGNLSRRLYVHQDANWDVISLADVSGADVNWSLYTDPNGTPAFTFGGTYLFSYGFQGGRMQPGGLVQFGVRDYDPNGPGGHWMEQEPFGENYIDGNNLYQFEAGNTVNRVDPTGLNYAKKKIHPDGPPANPKDRADLKKKKDCTKKCPLGQEKTVIILGEVGTEHIPTNKMQRALWRMAFERYVRQAREHGEDVEAFASGISQKNLQNAVIDPCTKKLIIIGHSGQEAYNQNLPGISINYGDSGAMVYPADISAWLGGCNGPDEVILRSCFQGTPWNHERWQDAFHTKNLHAPDYPDHWYYDHPD